ncbi:MAG TPA: hypothetical protein VM073_01745 [Usitatibacter sp.]|nr:hypothetical protein [Usitatibacter sp.]
MTHIRSGNPSRMQRSLLMLVAIFVAGAALFVATNAHATPPGNPLVAMRA